jgi:hypothetical protein
MKKSLNLIDCLECGARLSAQAEACPECGYPRVMSPDATPGDSYGELESAHSVLKEYRFLQIGGLLVLAVGGVAILADSRFAAGVTLTVGGVLYLTGLLGTWWNRRD